MWWFVIYIKEWASKAIMYLHNCCNLIQFNNLICHFYALNEIDIKRLKENKNFTKTHSNMSKFISYLSFRSACPRFTNVGSHISFREDEVWSSVNSNNWTAFRYLNIKEKSLLSPCRAKKNQINMDLDGIDILFNKLWHLIRWNDIRNSVLNEKVNEN